MSDALLELHEVSVRRSGNVLLDRVAFTVARGSIHALVGPNGAGKSTLISALLALAPFDGKIVCNYLREGRIGYVPQTFQIDRTLPMTVSDFLALSRQKRPACFGASANTKTRIAELLARVGLSGFERRALGALSGGELQRVLLANAIDPMPELLVLDEPASGLDSGAVKRFEEMILALAAEGVTVLMVAHDLEHVRRVAHRVTVLNRRVILDGPPGEVLAGASALLLGGAIPEAS